MAIKIEMLRGFAIVARSGNLSDAATKLGRTPSAVSMMLKQFENHLGEPLFETDRKNKLTALGVFTLEQAERELAQFDNTIKSIEGFANAENGRVRIAAVPSVAGVIFPKLFAEHHSQLARIDIDLRDMDSRSIMEALTREQIDIGIGTPIDNPAGVDCTPIVSDAFGVFFPAKHHFATGSHSIEWTDLQGEKLISNNLLSSINAPIAQSINAASRISAHNLTTALALVQAGVGITVLPKLAMESPSASGLRFRPLSAPSSQRQISLMKKADIPQSPAVTLIEQLITQGAFI